MKKIILRLLSLILLFSLLLYWEFLSPAKINYENGGGAIPIPSLILECFLELFYDKTLIMAIYHSLQRFILALSIGSVLGIICGLILGRFMSFELILEPFIQLLRPISPIAWLPIVVFFFGIGELGAIFVITYAVFFPVLLLTITGVRLTDKNLLLMAKNFGASEFLIFKKIILPSSFLYVLSGLKIAASIAWIQLVAAEMLGIQSGLGYLIIDGRNLLRMDMVIVAMIFIGILGSLIHFIFNGLEKIIKRRLGQ